MRRDQFINFNLNYQKLYKPFSNDLTDPKIIEFIKKILFDDRGFLYNITLYALIINLFGIAVPISVKLLINSVAATALLQPIVVLGSILFSLLVFSGILNAFQFYTVEIFQRRFMANMSYKLCYQLINADYKKCEEANMSELVNRFFDVTTIQKTVPKFLVKTISFIFQTIIGLILVSFYHPFFLIFSLVFIFLLYLIFIYYFKRASITAFLESRRKYDIIGNFEDIANNIALFKSKAGQSYAKYKTNELTKRYLIDRKAHFRNLFSQNILFLILYAASSTSLLILGGYLVLAGQLTIGQLVAAELVLSAILYSMSKLGGDFENMYDLVAACEKLYIFFNIPTEEKQESSRDLYDFKEITLENVSYKNNPDSVINLKIEKNKKYLIHDKEQITQKFFINILQGFERPVIGEVKIDNVSLYEYDMAKFRDYVRVINNRPLIEGTLLENITLGSQDIEIGKINQILKDLRVDKKINSFSDKLNVRVIPSGWPLSAEEFILIKVCRALVMEPKIIIMNESIDILNYDLRQKVIGYISKNSDATVIYFSNHTDDRTDIFDQVIDI